MYLLYIYFSRYFILLIDFSQIVRGFNLKFWKNQGKLLFKFKKLFFYSTFINSNCLVYKKVCFIKEKNNKFE